MQFQKSTWILTDGKISNTWEFKISGPNDGKFTIDIHYQNQDYQTHIDAPNPDQTFGTTAPVPGDISMGGLFHLYLEDDRYWLTMANDKDQVIILYPRAGLAGEGPFVLATWPTAKA